MSDDFSTSPRNLAEHRALSSGNPKDWNARDVLVYLLRKMDSGEMEVPDHVMILYGSEHPGEGNSTGFTQAGSFGPLTQMGLLHSTLHSLLHNN